MPQRRSLTEDRLQYLELHQGHRMQNLLVRPVRWIQGPLLQERCSVLRCQRLHHSFFCLKAFPKDRSPCGALAALTKRLSEGLIAAGYVYDFLQRGHR